jgi:alpha-tubulin suppressor-like RCC1 family protein
MADAALAALRAATGECASTAREISPAQSAEAAALVDKLRALFSTSRCAAATAELPVERQTPLLPQLPTELIVEVLQHLDVTSLGRLACTCRQLFFGPPCPPRPTSLVEAALRRRADEVGRWMPSSLPTGVSEWVPFLLQRQWRSGMDVRTVAAGWDRSFFVDEDSALLACGNEEPGEVGMLGLREGTSQGSFTAMVPTPLPSMVGVRIHAVACHDDCNLAVSAAGQVFAWGHKRSSASLDINIPLREWQAPVPTIMEELRNHRVRQVAVRQFHSAALMEEGALFTWLTPDEDDEPDEPIPKLGHGSVLHDVGVPRRVLAFEGMRITSVAVGIGFTVTTTEAGAVYSFGMGDARLGQGEGDEEEGVFLPKRIEALDGIYMSMVAAGDHHALALTRDGRVYSWAKEGCDSMVQGLGFDSDGVRDADGLNDDDFYLPLLLKGSPERACAGQRGGLERVMRRDRYGRAVHLGGEPRGKPRSRGRPRSGPAGDRHCA